MSNEISITKVRLPSRIISFIIATSFAPFFIHLLGFDLSSSHVVLTPEAAGSMNQADLHIAIFKAMNGSFTHLILEWTAISIAFATAALSFVQYRIEGNPTTPIIGIALLCAGFIDAFHALAASNLIHSVADKKDFIPFTWAISRLFNVLIIATGSTILLLRYKSRLAQHHQNIFVFITGSIFLIISYFVIKYCATSPTLFETTFPNQLIKRPYDVAPLLLFVIMAFVVFPKLYTKNKTVFVHSLMWSMLPAIATQLHMAFGSSSLFDAHFNIGHFLKCASYLVPFFGITIDYVSTYREEKNRLHELAIAHKSLEQKNKELEQYTYIASHDLQEPLRTLTSFSDLLQDNYKGKIDNAADQYLNFISQAANRMSLLIKGLLDYSRIGKNNAFTSVDTSKVLLEVKDDLATKIQETGAAILSTKLPRVTGNEIEIRQLFQNLITNALKFRKSNVKPEVRISANKSNDQWVFSFTDNGIGIAAEHQEKIFSIFQRLHARDEYEGTGIGLANCKKIVNTHGGKIWVSSSPNQGSTFYFTLPK